MTSVEDFLAWLYFIHISRPLSYALSEMRCVEGLFDYSNAWNVGSSKTVDGSVILYGDLHLPWTGMKRI